MKGEWKGMVGRPNIRIVSNTARLVFVYEYFLTAYFALAIILLYGRKDTAVSRICAPVKMQINLFVRNICAFEIDD